MSNDVRPIVVIKVGTSSLVDTVSGRVQVVSLARIAEAAARLSSRGYSVIIVSSGAVGLGCVRLGLREKPTTIAGKQAAAAVGQLKLLSLYDDFFGVLGHTVAQVLLTYDNFGDRTQYHNARAAFLELLRLGVIPIVNENDTVAVQELKVGDNDTLSALVAAMVGARWLLLLTDVDSLYTANPRDVPDAAPIRSVLPNQVQTLRRQMAEGAQLLCPDAPSPPPPNVILLTGAAAVAAAAAAAAATAVGDNGNSHNTNNNSDRKSRSPSRQGQGKVGGGVTAITSSAAATSGAVESGGTGSAFGTGGMITKLKAAQLATAAGTTVVIMNTQRIERLADVLTDCTGGRSDGLAPSAFASIQLGTTFLPAPTPVTSGHKKWILSLAPSGILYLDSGAASAVLAHKSLFAAGVAQVEGDFEAQDCVSLIDKVSGRELARALVNYSSIECAKLQGKSSTERAEVLGYWGAESLADRDNVVVIS
jgi:glutamate 5-kinase